jgi:hypothetical protein
MLLRNVFLKSFYVFVLVFLLVFIDQRIAPLTVKAQNTQWSTPQTIPGYHPETWPPILVADQNRTVHAFSSQWIEDESGQPLRAIVHNRWTLAQGWTTPTDIILSPSKEARLTDAYLDKDGMFHIVFFGGDNTFANIYYSQAPAGAVDNARAWSMPTAIGKNAGDPEGAVFSESDDGILNVVYNGREFGKGLYRVSSADGGRTWLDPTPIFFTLDGEPNISELEVIKSMSGWFHAIWAVNNTLGQGRGIYYAKSQDGNEWSEPVLLAAANDGLGTQVPTIFEHKNILFAIYITQLNQSNKTVMRQSHDGGETWEEPSMIFPRHQGVNGLISSVVDGNQNLHLFFGQRISGDPTIHGMWHSVYQNNRWIEPEGIVRGLKVLDTEGYDAFDPSSARAVVSQGNVILVTWRSDPGSKGNGVWFSHKRIDAPELPIVPLPTPAVVSSLSPGLTLADNYLNVTPLPSNIPLDKNLLHPPSGTESAGLIFGGVALIIFTFIVIVLISARKNQF